MKSNKNGVKLLATLAVLAMVFAGASVIMSDESDAATTYVSGGFTNDMEFPSGSTVVVNGDLTIDKGLVITVKSGATMTINKDVKVLVDGSKVVGEAPSQVEIPAKLIVENGARLVINGDLVIGEKGEASICIPDPVAPALLNDDTFVSGAYVFGSVTVQKGGDLAIIAQVMSSGSVSSTSTGVKCSTIAGALGLMSGAQVSVKSLIGNTNLFGDSVLSDAGLVVIAYNEDCSVNTESKVDYMLSIATVSSTSDALNNDPSSTKVPNYKFECSSETSTLYQVNGDKRVSTPIDTANLIVSADVKSSTLTFVYNEMNDNTYYKTNKSDDTTFVSVGTKTVIPADSSITVSKDGKLDIKKVNESDKSNVVVEGSISAKTESTVESNIDITGKILVKGTVDIEYLKVVRPAGIGGSIEIDGGSITIKTQDSINLNGADIYGAYYESSVADVFTTVICDLEAAINALDGDKVDKVTVSGWIGSDTSKFTGAYAVSGDFTVPKDTTLEVRNGLKIGSDYTVVFDADATIDLTSGKISVSGKLIDNTMYAGDNIKSEVVQKNDEAAVQIFTSLALAIAGAQDGDVITLSGPVDVKSSMTIPAGVTVDVNGNVFNVKNNAILTVDGVMIDTDGVIKTTAKTATKAAGKIIVNNYILTPTGFDEGIFNAAGIYGMLTIKDAEKKAVMSPTVYIANAKEIEEAGLYGVVEIKDAFTLAGEDNNKLEIYGELTVSTITIDGFTVEIKDGGKFTGKVANSVGTIDLSKVEGSLVSSLVIKDVYDEADEVYKLKVSGTPTSEIVKSDRVGTISVVTGTAVVDAAFTVTELKSITIGDDATLVLDDTLTVEDLTVGGTVKVGKTGSINATNVMILGIVSIDESIAGYGITATKDIYLGTTQEYPVTTAGAAELIGTQISCDRLYVLAGSVVDEKFSEEKPSVEFYVEGALWMTVFKIGSVDNVKVNDAPATTGIFQKWTDEKGVTYTDYTVPFGNDVVKAIAVYDYEIYDVKVVADNGIGTVAIDGVVLIKSSNVFIAENLKAGTHTISFELKNGYEGTVKMTVNGQAVSGYNFTLSGTSGDDLKVTVNLSGTAPAEPTTPVTPTPTPSEKDDGMGITDYLLIVLVIMVVILAIVVIARMFRS